MSIKPYEQLSCAGVLFVHLYPQAQHVTLVGIPAETTIQMFNAIRGVEVLATSGCLPQP